MGFLEEISWRGLLHQKTAEKELDDHLASGMRLGYVGFDPTSDSLTIGNFIPAKLLMHWQQAGHKPIVLMGGGTGLIGDPSGRESERTLMTRDQVDANVASQQRILEHFLDFDPNRPNGAILINNIDWLEGLGFIEVLREVGKHFSVNEMIQRDSVKRRLEEREHGISFTEFSYMILQAYDFLHIRREFGCTVQLGGADQYGNIVSGIDLIRREYGPEEGRAYGITAPLVSRSDGKKMGKSTGGAVWMSDDTTERTSPYGFYQYWINLPDSDVAQWLKWYTTYEKAQIETIVQTHEQNPHLRQAQQTLAGHMTELIHGSEMLSKIESACKALFSGDVRQLDATMLEEVIADVPHSSHDKSSLEGEGLSLIELLPLTTLANSKREAREFLGNGAVSVNGERVEAERVLKTGDLLYGGTILIRRGKKSWHATKWQ